MRRQASQYRTATAQISKHASSQRATVAQIQKRDRCESLSRIAHRPVYSRGREGYFAVARSKRARHHFRLNFYSTSRQYPKPSTPTKRRNRESHARPREKIAYLTSVEDLQSRCTPPTEERWAILMCQKNIILVHVCTVFLFVYFCFFARSCWLIKWWIRSRVAGRAETRTGRPVRLLLTRRYPRSSVCY